MATPIRWASIVLSMWTDTLTNVFWNCIKDALWCIRLPKGWASTCCVPYGALFDLRSLFWVRAIQPEGVSDHWCCMVVSWRPVTTVWWTSLALLMILTDFNSLSPIDYRKNVKKRESVCEMWKHLIGDRASPLLTILMSRNVISEMRKRLVGVRTWPLLTMSIRHKYLRRPSATSRNALSPGVPVPWSELIFARDAGCLRQELRVLTRSNCFLEPVQ